MSEAHAIPRSEELRLPSGRDSSDTLVVAGGSNSALERGGTERGRILGSGLDADVGTQFALTTPLRPLHGDNKSSSTSDNMSLLMLFLYVKVDGLELPREERPAWDMEEDRVRAWL